MAESNNTALTGNIPMRDGYGHALRELCQIRDDIMVLDADVAKSTRTVWIRDEYPEHFLDMGIAEQDMAGTAAGMALGGLTPFISTYGVFLAGRAWDQIRTTICYNNLNVKLGGAHAGLSVGKDGATHQALEDIALMRALPHMTVLVPCDAEETRKATLAAAAIDGPVYIRFGREAVPVITDAASPFEIGKARCVYGTDVNTLSEPKDGETPSCVIFANGAQTGEALQAAQLLSEQNIPVTVYDLHTVKPLDKETVLAAARNAGRIVTIEEHQKAGGMGSAVAEYLAEACPVSMRILAVDDTFGQTGTPDELYDHYHLRAADIVNAVRSLL